MIKKFLIIYRNYIFFLCKIKCAGTMHLNMIYACGSRGPTGIYRVQILCINITVAHKFKVGRDRKNLKNPCVVTLQILVCYCTPVSLLVHMPFRVSAVILCFRDLRVRVHAHCMCKAIPLALWLLFFNLCKPLTVFLFFFFSCMF